MATPGRALNPASQAWGRGVEKVSSGNEENLKRATLTLTQADATLQGAITRLNKSLAAIDAQQKYLLALQIQYLETLTEQVTLPTNSWTSPRTLDAKWNGNDGVRPKLTVNSPTGKIKITIAAYGRSAMLTYSIAGVRPRTDALTKGINPLFSQLLLAGVAGSGQRDWVQEVPKDTDVTVVVETLGNEDNPFVASPSLTVQVIP